MHSRHVGIGEAGEAMEAVEALERHIVWYHRPREDVGESMAFCKEGVAHRHVEGERAKPCKHEAEDLKVTLSSEGWFGDDGRPRDVHCRVGRYP